jgi:hypothetical protein
MKIINLIQSQQIKKRNLNKNKLIWSSVTNLRGVRCWFQGGFWCSVRYYHEDDYLLDREREKEREDLKNLYKISWTKDYKNLNNLLSIKGLDSNQLIDENNIRYLVFSLTDNKYSLSAINDKDGVLKTPRLEKDIFYSVSLILQSSGFKDENNKWLYKIILSRLQENSSLIKEGGQLDIYYVASSELEENVKEGYRYEEEVGEGNLANYTGTPNKKLIPSISEVIHLNKVINNKLKVNIFVFSCDTFFRTYLQSTSINVFSPYTYLDRNKNKAWSFPFLIIEEMTLSTVTYLFKEIGLNLHGMSTTRRHKLSPLQKNLSNFLYITDLDDTIQKTHLIYIDKIYTNKKIDLDIHKNIYEIHKQNTKIFRLLKDDIRNMEQAILNLSEKKKKTDTNIDNQSQQINKIKEFYSKRLNYLNNKLLNLNEQSMSPKVIIFMLRNLIFNLEIEKWRIESHKDIKNQKKIIYLSIIE